ncbi:MAG: hypothetical protein ACUVTZ_08005 [Armatimonadota bacterium]
MSLAANLVAYLRERADRSKVHIVAAGGQPLELALDQRGAPRQYASVIEDQDGVLQTRRIPPASGSGFTHFLDGVQQSSVVMYIGEAVPVIYGCTAAVIRQRLPDGTMTTWGQPRSREALYFPFDLVDAEELRALQDASVDCCDTGFSGSEGVRTIAGIYEKGMNAVRVSRAHLERELLAEWQAAFADSTNAWLAVDGSLRELTRIRETAGNIVGIVKDCRTPYFDWTDQARVFALPAGYRTSVFQTPHISTDPVHSWYQRLWDNARRDILFGLIRVEIPARPDSIQLADTISAWLHAERSPLSRPDPRWDHLIYPIHDCEQFLRSISPSMSTVQAILSSMGD